MEVLDFEVGTKPQRKKLDLLNIDLKNLLDLEKLVILFNKLYI